MSVHFCSATVQFDCSATAHTAELPRKAVVGYSTIEIPEGYSIFTPVFENCDSSKTFTLSQITVCNSEGVEFDNKTKFGDDAYNKLHQSVKTISVRKLKGGEFIADLAVQYTSAGWNADPALRKNTWGWGTSGTMELTSGEGVIVYNNQGTKVNFRVSGAVQLVPGYTVPQNYSIFGNNTPVDITLGDITVCNSEGDEFDNKTKFGDDAYNKLHQSVKTISVRKLKDGEFIADLAVQYTSAGWNADPALRKNTWGWGDNKTMTIEAGEAVIIYNKQGTDVIFKLKSPIEK